jgi:hypothetical protein
MKKVHRVEKEGSSGGYEDTILEETKRHSMQNSFIDAKKRLNKKCQECVVVTHTGTVINKYM